jgi:signal transduction histidine kinase
MSNKNPLSLKSIVMKLDLFNSLKVEVNTSNTAVDTAFYENYRRQKVTLQFTFYSFLANVLFLINDIFIGHVFYLVLIDVFVVLFYGALYIYNKRTNNQRNTAITLAASSNIWLFYNADLYGKESLIFIFFFTLSLMTFFLFDFRKRLQFFGFLAAPIICLLILFLKNFSIFQENSFSNDEIYSTSILSIIGNLILFYVFINGIVSSVYRIETIFNEEKAKLIDSRLALNNLNDKLRDYNENLNSELEKAKSEILKQQKENQIIHLKAEEGERKRISQELHDSIGVLLSTSKMKLEKVKNQQTEKDTALNEAINLIDNTIIEVRYISQNLQPVLFKELGLVKVLHDMFFQINKLKANFSIKFLNKGYTQQLNREKEMILFRVIMEKINNILKHANASEAIVQLIALENQLHISIEDDGDGYIISEVKTGLGNLNSEYRIGHLGGSINIESGAGKGTLVQIEIPLS